MKTFIYVLAIFAIGCGAINVGLGVYLNDITSVIIGVMIIVANVLNISTIRMLD